MPPVPAGSWRDPRRVLEGMGMAWMHFGCTPYLPAPGKGLAKKLAGLQKRDKWGREKKTGVESPLMGTGVRRARIWEPGARVSGLRSVGVSLSRSCHCGQTFSRGFWT